VSNEGGDADEDDELDDELGEVFDDKLYLAILDVKFCNKPAGIVVSPDPDDDAWFDADLVCTGLLVTKPPPALTLLPDEGWAKRPELSEFSPSTSAFLPLPLCSKLTFFEPLFFDIHKFGDSDK
jgi:hypothetical protein